MARAGANERVDLSQLKALIDLLREKGVVRFAQDGLEVVLGPPTAKKEVKSDLDPNQDRRVYYEQMLNRSVGNDELARLP